MDETEARRLLARNGCGEPVGFRLRHEPNAPTCHDGCFAPGSSPHSHPKLLQTVLIGTTGYIEVNPDGYIMVAGTIHPLSKLEEST